MKKHIRQNSNKYSQMSILHLHILSNWIECIAFVWRWLFIAMIGTCPLKYPINRNDVSAYGLHRIQFVYSNWHLNEWCWHVAEALDGCIWQIPTDAKPDILAMTHSPFRTRPRLIRTEHAMSMAIFYRDFLLRLNSNAQRQSHGYSRQCSRDQPTESRVQNNRIKHKIRDTTLSQSHIRVKRNNR